MAGDAKNREDARDTLASLLNTALTGVGNPVQAVYGYFKSDFEGASPVVLVLSGGARRRRLGLGTERYKSLFRLNVLVFVATAKSSESWTDQDVEDTLDLIEKKVSDVISDNQSHANWNLLERADEFSRILPTSVGGSPYMMESIPAIAEVHDD